MGSWAVCRELTSYIWKLWRIVKYDTGVFRNNNGSPSRKPSKVDMISKTCRVDYKPLHHTGSLKCLDGQAKVRCGKRHQSMTSRKNAADSTLMNAESVRRNTGGAGERMVDGTVMNQVAGEVRAAGDEQSLIQQLCE